jgi:hypothetical protein
MFSLNVNVIDPNAGYEGLLSPVVMIDGAGGSVAAASVVKSHDFEVPSPATFQAVIVQVVGVAAVRPEKLAVKVVADVIKYLLPT